MNTQILSDKIATFILSQTQPVSYTAILERSKTSQALKDLENTTQLVRESLLLMSKRHPEVRVTVRGSELWYEARQEHVPNTPQQKYTPTIEQQQKMDKERDDFYRNSPFVTPEERACYFAYTPTRYKTCTCNTCKAIRFLLMTKQERAVMEFDRMQEFDRSLS